MTVMFDKLDSVMLHYEEIQRELSSPDIASDQKRFRSLMKEQSDLAPLVEAYSEYRSAQQTILDCEEMLEAEHDEEMRGMLKEELAQAREDEETLREKLRIMLLPKDPNDEKNVVVEIRAGVGGDEKVAVGHGDGAVVEAVVLEMVEEHGLEIPAQAPCLVEILMAHFITLFHFVQMEAEVRPALIGIEGTLLFPVNGHKTVFQGFPVGLVLPSLEGGGLIVVHTVEAQVPAPFRVIVKQG